MCFQHWFVRLLGNVPLHSLDIAEKKSDFNYLIGDSFCPNIGAHLNNCEIPTSPPRRRHNIITKATIKLEFLRFINKLRFQPQSISTILSHSTL